MRITRTVEAVALVAVLVGSQAGCAPVHADPGFLVNPTRPTDYLEAIIEGDLVRDDDGCFGLAGEFGTHITVFPNGSTLAEDEQSIDVPGVGTVELGDHIDGGGGYFSGADVAEMVGIAVPVECARDEIAVLNPF